MSKAQQEQLLKDITLMMTDTEAASDDNKIEELMTKIRQLNPKKAAEQLRLAACHFMTMYHTRKAMSMGMPDQMQQQQADPYLMGIQGPQQQALQMQEQNINLEKVEAFKDAQRTDMEMGWNFLDFEDDGNKQSQAVRTARVLKIELAQRLEDSQRLKSAFDDLMKNQLSEEETLVAFTAAPFLGDWKAMMKLGKKIEKYPGGLEQLHMMSLQLPIPDFTLVYALAKEHNLSKNKTQNVNSLVWDLYNVDKIRVKFKDVDCGEFEEKRKELLEEIHKQGDVNWEDVPTITNVHIKRMGALCQAVSFGEMPMMLNGPWFGDIIHVRGRAEMPMMPEDQNMGPSGMNPYMQNPENLTFLVQEEEWFLHQSPENPNLFEGTYTLKQKPMLPDNQEQKPEHAPVNMTFDCQIFIGKSKTINNNNNNNDNDDNKENKSSNNNEDDDDVMENEDNNEKVTSVVTEFDGLTLD